MSICTVTLQTSDGHRGRKFKRVIYASSSSAYVANRSFPPSRSIASTHFTLPGPSFQGELSVSFSPKLSGWKLSASCLLLMFFGPLPSGISVRGGRP